jgi:hypothetical protein
MVVLRLVMFFLIREMVTLLGFLREVVVQAHQEQVVHPVQQVLQVHLVQQVLQVRQVLLVHLELLE